MATRNFQELLEGRWRHGNFLCIGLDSELEKIPESARKASASETIIAFNKKIVDATKDLVCAFKPNPAFYEAQGEDGWIALRETINYILETAHEVPVILDAKRGDIDNTNLAYAASAFDRLRVDAVTVQPFLGGEPLQSFFRRAEKGIIVLCHTSNPGAGEIQNLIINNELLYKVIARLATTKWNGNGNCCVMVGATYTEELREVREIVGDMTILTAGIGSQNGDLAKTIKAGMSSKGAGLIVNASRSVIFASKGRDFADAAREKAMTLDGEIRGALS